MSGPKLALTNFVVFIPPIYLPPAGHCKVTRIDVYFIMAHILRERSNITSRPQKEGGGLGNARALMGINGFCNFYSPLIPAARRALQSY